MWYQKFKKRVKSKKWYKILDESKVSGSTFQCGGCWVMADALSMYFEVPLYVVYNETDNRVEHFVVKLNKDCFMDSEGTHSTKEMINKVIEDGFYYNKEIVIKKYNEKLNTEGLVRDLETSKIFYNLLLELDTFKN